MTIRDLLDIDETALQGLRKRCLEQLAKGNDRKATKEEIADILQRVEDAGYALSWDVAVKRNLEIRPLFTCLDYFLILALEPHSPWEKIAAGIAIDILNKEEEDAKETN